MSVATEDVNAADIAICDRGKRSEHRVDDGRLIAPRGFVGTNTDLREADPLRLLQDVGDVREGRVERVQRGVGLGEVSDALVAAFDDVIQNGDGRGADRVLRGTRELLPAREPNLQQKQLAIGALNAAKRNSRRQKVRNAGEVGRNCAHGGDSATRRQPPCQGRFHFGSRACARAVPCFRA